MGAIFAKTRKGQQEIETRSGGLHPRVRRTLIVVDGKRSVDELREIKQLMSEKELHLRVAPEFD